jgi:prepilin-type N-terminal cleavage/methylation domain-containing protein
MHSKVATKRSTSGFTAIELIAVIAVGAAVSAHVMPMAKRARSNAQGLGSTSNLMQVGQAAGMYGVDNADRIPTYSWEGNAGASISYRYTLPDGNTYTARSDDQAAAIQQADILQRRTGRIDGEFAILVDLSRLPQRRFTNLILLDYMDSPLFDPVFIDPADANLLSWAANPLEYGVGSTVPYANGDPGPGYDLLGLWANEGIRQRWAFGSSYQAVPAAWQPDGLDGAPSYAPVASTPHLFAVNGIRVELSEGRRFSEVRFPTAKVYQFEEFDREQAGDPYFGYDQARVEKLMFDGSVNNLASGDANPSFSVLNPGLNGKTEWRQTYVPLDTFPVPLAGLGDDTLISQRFRWTLGGLQGIDYATPIMPGNPAALGRER